jgi:hypothetical protein
MIELNLTPGASRKSKGRGAGFSLAGVVGDGSSSLKDPFLLAAIASLIVAAGTVGTMHMTQTSTATELAAREEQAVADSTRFATVLRQRRTAEAKRDSVLKQLSIIRPSTPTGSSGRTSWTRSAARCRRTPGSRPSPITAPQAYAPSGARPAPAPTDEARAGAGAREFRLCNTVDIQALTRFMKLLEASPFIQNVQLTRSELAMLDGKEVTEFMLEAMYERPDSSMIVTAPVSLSVRQ